MFFIYLVPKSPWFSGQTEQYFEKIVPWNETTLWVILWFWKWDAISENEVCIHLGLVDCGELCYAVPMHTAGLVSKFCCSKSALRTELSFSRSPGRFLDVFVNFIFLKILMILWADMNFNPINLAKIKKNI